MELKSKHYEEQLKKLYAWMSKLEKMYKNDLSCQDRIVDQFWVSVAWWRERKAITKGTIFTNSKIIQLSKDWEVIKVWNSAREAALNMNTRPSWLKVACDTWGLAVWYKWKVNS